MSIDDILIMQAWKAVPRSHWIAIKDSRPEFRVAFKTDRVGKRIDTRFYVTLTELSEVTRELIGQLGREPESIKSTNAQRNVTYWGFDTSGVSEEHMHSFVKGLANAIDDRIHP